MGVLSLMQSGFKFSRRKYATSIPESLELLLTLSLKKTYKDITINFCPEVKLSMRRPLSLKIKVA